MVQTCFVAAAEQRAASGRFVSASGRRRVARQERRILMKGRITRAALIGIGTAGLAWIAPPASAQTGARDSGVPTETQERLSQEDTGFDWNWIGLIGLFGLAGLHRRPDYHDPI
jgi:hypothetical protein